MAGLATLLFLVCCLPALALELEGHFTQGGIAYGKTHPDSQLWFDGQRLRLGPQGEFIFGFAYRAPRNMVLRIQQDDDTINKVLHIQQRRYLTQRIEGLAAEKVSPPPRVWERIRRENKLIGKARSHDTRSKKLPISFVWPVLGKITGVYGSRRILNGKERQPHYGIDIACKEGTKVRAPADGIVRLKHPDMYFSGKTLVLDHGYGISSTLIHLSRITVQEGDKVQQQEVVAEVGSTGRSTGAHLDWRVNWFHVRLDPSLLAGEMPAAGACAP